MNVIEIKPNGFCDGVVRAIRILDAALNDANIQKPIYMFGSLVHNKHVVDMYKDRIIMINDNFDEEIKKINQGTVIFTAHGIKPSIINYAKEKGLNIIDTTCPKVAKIQKLIKQKLSDGYVVYVIGNKNHPEVLNYLGIGDRVKIYDGNLPKENKSFIVNQTTLIYDDVLKTYEQIKKSYDNVEIAMEVCNATKVRQQALSKYASKCDAIIVVGDKQSNNCTSLYNVACTYLPSYKIESKDELDKIPLSMYNTIGVTAGASTPRILIDEVIEELKKRP